MCVFCARAFVSLPGGHDSQTGGKVWKRKTLGLDAGVGWEEPETAASLRRRQEAYATRSLVAHLQQVAALCGFIYSRCLVSKEAFHYPLCA